MGRMDERRTALLKMSEESKILCEDCTDGDHTQHVGTFLDLNRRVMYCSCELCLKRLPESKRCGQVS
jgi:hypothetical protein